MALPHLPARRPAGFPDDAFIITDGYRAIIELARNLQLDETFKSLFVYFQRFWMNNFQPNGFSVYGFSIKTNNFIESFHSTLRTIIGHHLQVWTFYGNHNTISLKYVLLDIFYNIYMFYIFPSTQNISASPNLHHLI